MNPNKNKSVFVTTAGFGSVAVTTRWVLTLCSALLLAGPVGAVERPFQGRIDGQFVATPTLDPTVYVGGAQAVGNGTHVGAFTKVTSDVTDIATGEVEGSFTMTAANGDHVTGVYGGFIVFGSTPGTFSWVLDATITGGSGRFSGATGEFVFIADGESVITDGVVYGKYTETFDGSIDY
ncbi:MAG: hypothetical protein DME26_02260 [Verrucomicrobia bacterium]|nr:MAG: hypothetical protein DME26_02260 [Verrucomicrobiota bacterium]